MLSFLMCILLILSSCCIEKVVVSFHFGENYFVRRIKDSAVLKPRRIGFLLTRFGGKDGVSEEAIHWINALKRYESGHEIYVFTGKEENLQRLENLTRQRLIENIQTVNAASLDDDKNNMIHQHVFNGATNLTESELKGLIQEVKEEIKKELLHFIDENNIEVLVQENILSLLRQIPFALALMEVVEEHNIPLIARHHDFTWGEGRDKDYSLNPNYPGVKELIQELNAFIANSPNITNVTINPIARKRLAEQMGVDSLFIPNSFDYDNPPQEISSEEEEKLRELLGLGKNDIVFLVPTRVVERKNIEQAIEIVANLKEFENIKLVIGLATEQIEYRQELEHLAQVKGVSLIFAYDKLLGTEFNPWDIFWISTFAHIPSKQEGFGNNLLEAIAYKRPVIVNRFPVLIEEILPRGRDISPKGFDFIELDGDNSEFLFNATTEIQQMLKYIQTYGEYSPEVQAAIEKNYEIAEQLYNYFNVYSLIEEILLKLQ